MGAEGFGVDELDKMGRIEGRSLRFALTPLLAFVDATRVGNVHKKIDNFSARPIRVSALIVEELGNVDSIRTGSEKIDVRRSAKPSSSVLILAVQRANRRSKPIEAD